jgi:hypothetical protein
MGRALQVISGRATNPAALAVVTADTGDSFTVRSFPFESAAEIVQLWALAATAGVVRVRSPRLHDQAQGIRLRTLAANSRPLFPDAVNQRLYPQDNLTVEIQGGGAETDSLSLLVYYPDLPGVDARLATWAEIAPRVVNVLGLEQAVTTGATLGDYSGSQAVNADFDTIKRNVNYALLGYITDTMITSVGVTGPDTGNLRVGGPGATAPEITANWFVYLAEQTGYPCIPILNGANIGATTFDVVHNTNAVAVNVSLILAELTG